MVAGDRQITYLEEVVVLAVLLVFLLFLCLWVLFIVLSVLAVEVFWANTAVPESSERPRAAIMIFFI